MSGYASEERLEALFQQALELEPARRDALWADFQARVEKEADSWASFAMVMSLYGRRLCTVLALGAA